MYNTEPHSWNCEVCGNAIERAEDGCIEWMYKYRPRVPLVTGLRLVHNWVGCRHDLMLRNVAEIDYVDRRIPLNDCIGVDGLMYLLSLISSRTLPKDAGREIIQRLHVSGYDTAHRHFSAAIKAGVIEAPINGYYRQRDINAVLNWLRDHPR